ncbi:unnamed protein product [Trichobilharzia regenti]|nr:unnamed protein product [Trichobilharzia regenti]
MMSNSQIYPYRLDQMKRFHVIVLYVHRLPHLLLHYHRH